MDAAYPTPDWSFWRQAETVTVFEAVALSLNIDPAALTGRPISGRGGIAFRWILPPIFHHRFELAMRSLGGTLPTANALGLREPSVELQRFAAWAIRFDWNMPDELLELPAGGAQPDLPSGPRGEPTLNAATRPKLPKRPQRATEYEWKIYCDAKELMPSFEEKHGGISKVAGLIAVARRDSTKSEAIRRALTRVRQAMRKK